MCQRGRRAEDHTHYDFWLLCRRTVVSQCNGHPAKMHHSAFFYWKVTTAKWNYDVGNWELLAVKAALEEWCYWLDGVEYLFLILTDYTNLECVKSAKRGIPCQARWPLFTYLRFALMYWRGSKNNKADALSHLHNGTHVENLPETILEELWP